MTIAPSKSTLRAEAKRRRATCNPALGERMAAHVLRDCHPRPGAIIGGFWPLEGEIDTRFLLRALSARGHVVTLPETTEPGNALVFRKWAPGEELLKGRFNTFHPAGEIMVPDFALVPLLAFDKAGNRLGYGGGYYDRTLATLPNAFRLGCAFAAQEIENLPIDPTDLPLHAMATEVGIRLFSNALSSSSPDLIGRSTPL
jgi:5-formyltetrahydrofolate cyclo-ligase